MLGLKAAGFSPEELEQFRRWQRLSYRILDETRATLRAGDSEKAVGLRIHHALRAAGAQNYFHAAVALFGDRTSYPGAFGQFEALPTGRTLREGDAVILDVAPIFDGFTVDTSLAAAFGSDAEVPRELDRALVELRAGIADRVRRGLTMRQITREIDAAIAARGLDNCHRKHIARVLGHRVTRATDAFGRSFRLFGISPRHAGWFILQTVRSNRRGSAATPNWNDTRQSDLPTPDGLWAVEPHLARQGVGAKFEELLLVQDGRVEYLDDDLPHHRRWRKAGLIAGA